MSKYKEIKGFKVQTLASDTAASLAASGSWSSGGTMNSTGHAWAGGTGIKAAALSFGGEGPPSFSPRYIGLTEQYDGTTWTEKADLNAARAYMGGAGTTTASLCTGGNSGGPYTAANEEWNGSAWSEDTDLNVASNKFAQNGTSTASFVAGGLNGSTNYAATHEVWNGSSWSEEADLNTARNTLTGFGITTAAVVAGGRTPGGPSGVNNVESWNGSSWSEVAEVNSAFYAGASSGIATDGLVFAGYYPPNNLARTEQWNGSAWTELADLATAKRDTASANSQPGNSASALNIAGYATDYIATTEEWTTTPAADFTKQNLGQVYYNSGSNAFKVTAQPIAGGTWASATSLNSARAYIGSAGLKTAFLAFGGNGHVGVTESYNGSSWTEVADLNTGRFAGASGGSQTAAFMAGGRISTTASSVVSEEWNGSSWAEGNDLNLDRYAITTGMGTQTAGLAVSGNKRFSPSASPAYFAGTEQYNGTSWTEVNDLPTAMESAGGIGTQTAAGQWGGYNGSYINSGFLYDGTSWTTTTNFPISGGNFSTSGTTTAGLMFGIFDNGPGVGVANNLSWDGTSFTEVADLGTARNAGGGPTASLGTTSSAILAGGYSTTYVANTEEWTVPEANSTITVS